MQTIMGKNRYGTVWMCKTSQNPEKLGSEETLIPYRPDQDNMDHP